MVRRWGIKLNLEVKCPRGPWLEWFTWSDLDGEGDVGEFVRRGRRARGGGKPVTGMFFKFDKARHD